jgi:hypothetical protein
VDVDDYREMLGSCYADRRWIVSLSVLAGATPVVDQLAEMGAESCLCIGGSRGTGDLPDPEIAPVQIVLGTGGGDMLSAMRSFLDATIEVPDEVAKKIDDFDPQRTARVIGPIFDHGRPLAGRSKYGARPEAWQRLEDKTVIDALWDEIGIPRVPSRVVDAELESLQAASEALPAELGHVWVGDNREGFHGGATRLRVVRDADDARRAAEFLGTHSDRARVMPFLEGIPCSIHGIVFPDYTARFRPCEMLVFRRPERMELHYGRAASFWDPPEDDRAQMREVARRVGDHLREAVDYRGAFTVDGVMTAEGFRPTELNPRFGAALGVLTTELDLPMMLLNLAVVEGEDLDWRPRELERLVVERADAHRSGRGLAMVERDIDENHSAELVYDEDDGAWRLAGEDEEPDARAVLGPAPSGGYLSISLEPGRTPAGPSVAPRMAAALAWADAHWELDIGPLESARDVRPGA